MRSSCLPIPAITPLICATLAFAAMTACGGAVVVDGVNGDVGGGGFGGSVVASTSGPNSRGIGGSAGYLGYGGYSGYGGSCESVLAGSFPNVSWTESLAPADFSNTASWDAYSAANTCACLPGSSGCALVCQANFCQGAPVSNTCVVCLETACMTQLEACLLN